MKTFLPALLFLLFTGCSQRHPSESKMVSSQPVAAAVKADSEPQLRNCIFSNKDFGFEIDSCNCGDITTSYDTIAIDLFPPEGGHVQGCLMKVSYPVCDSSCYILMKYENRYCVGSMGPDPLLTDWKFYESPYDTIRYNSWLGGFLLDTISQEEQSRFPAFDTIDFYKAYQRAVGNNLRDDNAPGIAKAALDREYKTCRKNARLILQDSFVELHRVILVLYQGQIIRKVFLFNYGHMG